MNILNKVSIKNLKLNKKRTISTIIGIILSVALICAACTLATSFQATLIENAKNQSGYYHLAIEGIEEADIKTIKNNRDVKDIYTVFKEGYSKLENGRNEDKPYLKLCSMNQNDFENLKFRLVEGRFANNNNEIVISSHAITNGGLEYKIEDTITLNVGKRESLDHYPLNSHNPYEAKDEQLVNLQKRTFTIVGIIERPDYNFEDYSDAGYTVITTGDTNTVASKIDVYIALAKPKEYKTSIPELLGAENMEQLGQGNIKLKCDSFSTNHELLRWEAFAFSDSTVNMLYSVIGVVVAIILFTSVFCIRNSFAISTTEKIKMYGMLASVGATKKQIKKSVIFEALVLGTIGIPLGILSGVFAVFVLIQIVNYLLAGSLLPYTDGICLNVSIIPIIISVILGFLTVYLSAISSAKKASKVSPIEQLRNTQDIKINSKKLKTPGIISKLFNVGGVLAYKNLKRSKKKYRTTVISLTVSICIFITMNAFLTNTLGLAGNYYEDYDYNIVISMDSSYKMTQDELNKITSLDNIKDYFVLYSDERKYIEILDLNKINALNLTQEKVVRDEEGKVYIDEVTGMPIKTGIKYMGLQVLALDNKSFEKYAKKIGENYEKVKTSGILCDSFTDYQEDTGNTKETRTYKYNKNDIITGKYKGNEVNIKVGAVTKIHPYGYEQYNYHGGFLIVNYDEHPEFDFSIRRVTIQSDKPDRIEKEIEDLKLEIDVRNIDSEAQSERAMSLVIQIFLYGFITVITLIGVTNIFNTITSNMELRQKEFAMLKSIGMTKREFNRMINLETIFYGTKSLIYGIILGLLGTFALYKAFSVKIDSGIYIPVSAIMLSVVFVFVLIFIIMRYSVGKINKQNTIETIRRENV